MHVCCGLHWHVAERQGYIYVEAYKEAHVKGGYARPAPLFPVQGCAAGAAARDGGRDHRQRQGSRCHWCAPCYPAANA